MRPRTKLQHRVLGLSKGLSLATKEQEDWAFEHCLEHKAFRTTKTIFCLDCGHVESRRVTTKSWVCPNCERRLKVSQTLHRTDKQGAHFGILTMHEEFQLVRIFEMYGYYKKGEKMRRFFWEIAQYWILPNGKHEVIARNHTVNWSVDSWNGDLEIRDRRQDRYYAGVYKFHPDYQCLPELKRNGFRGELYGASPLHAFKAILENSRTETLLKARQPALFRLSVANPHEVHRLWPSIRICLRNKYKVADARMWIDTIQLLRQCEKDILNAKYVCPKNLKAMHDHWMEQVRRKRECERRESDRVQMLKDEKNYLKSKGKFFGLAITNGQISVEVLQSVHDIMLEGDAMHHCVFSAEYHRKPESLILSAHIDGRKLETVEFSLTEMEVVQCRGYNNKSTEYHDTIVNLVNQNKHLIKQRMMA